MRELAVTEVVKMVAVPLTKVINPKEFAPAVVVDATLELCILFPAVAKTKFPFTKLTFPLRKVVTNCWVPLPVPAPMRQTLDSPRTPGEFIITLLDSAPVYENPALNPSPAFALPVVIRSYASKPKTALSFPVVSPVRTDLPTPVLPPVPPVIP
jgi:hypothetical protein